MPSCWWVAPPAPPWCPALLREKCGLEPHREIHPDLCVALGAAVLGSRLAGQQVNRVLVDVSPFSFGPSYLGTRDGQPYPYCYHPVIERNTPLPVTRTDKYFTATPYQETVQFEIFQGEDEDALKNIPVGHFQLDDLKPMPTPSEVLCRMTLDVDGILKVTATQKETGKSAPRDHLQCPQDAQRQGDRGMRGAASTPCSRRARTDEDDEEKRLEEPRPRP